MTESRLRVGHTPRGQIGFYPEPASAPPSIGPFGCGGSGGSRASISDTRPERTSRPVLKTSNTSMTDWAASNPGVEMMVDLERNVIEAPGLQPISFSMDARIRDKLLTGSVDELDEMLQHSEGATELRSEDRNTRPWIYQNATGANR